MVVGLQIKGQQTELRKLFWFLTMVLANLVFSSPFDSPLQACLKPDLKVARALSALSDSAELSHLDAPSKWYHQQGHRNLDPEFMDRLSRKLGWGSKDVKDQITLWPLQTYFSLVWDALKRTHLTDTEIASLFEVPNEVVSALRTHSEYRIHEGKLLLF